MARNTRSRMLHDLGLSAWFGGTLANAVALNAAAGEAGSDSATGRVARQKGVAGMSALKTLVTAGGRRGRPGAARHPAVGDPGADRHTGGDQLLRR